MPTLVDSVARLHVRGGRIDWFAFTRRGERRSVRLPTTPFQRQRFGIPWRSAERRVPAKLAHDLLGARLSVAGAAAQFERRVNSTDPAWVADHRIGGEAVMPLTAYLEIALAAARQVRGAETAALQHVEVAEPLPLREGEERLLQVMVDSAGASERVRIFSRDAAHEDEPWLLHASAPAADARRGIDRRCSTSLAHASAAPARWTSPPFYERMRDLGADFGPRFARDATAWRAATAKRSARSKPIRRWSPKRKAFAFHPALLDACFHVAAVALDSIARRRRWAHVPADRCRTLPLARTACRPADAATRSCARRSALATWW